MNADYELIKNIEKSIPSFDTYIEDVWVDGIEYPLDQEVRNILFDKIDLNKDADNFEIYKCCTTSGGTITDYSEVQDD